MSDHIYGSQATDFQVGQRIATHPATAAWLSGDRHGRVIKIGRKLVSVELDSGRKYPFHPHDIRTIDQEVSE